MAYGLLYYNEVTSLRFGRTMRMEILERDYVGASSEILMSTKISLGNSGDGREEPIKKKTANISILSTKSFEFKHLFTSDDKKYQFKVFRASTLIFIGFLETDSYSEPYAFYQNYEVNFTARDNLGTLEDIDYLDGSGDKLTGLQKITEIINNTLLKTGYFLNKNDLTTKRSSDMNEAFVPFDQSYINNDGFWNYDDNEPISCLEVITRILTGFGAQIRQIGDLWQIREQARYFEMPFINGDDIIPRFLQSELNLNITPNDTYWINQSANLILQPAWKSFKLEQNYGVSEGVFDNFVASEDDFDYIGGTGLDSRYNITKQGWDMVDMPYVFVRDNFKSFVISFAAYYISADLKTLKADSNTDLQLKINVESLYSIPNTGNYTAYLDVLLTGSSSTKILTSNGWVDYISQSKQLVFSGLTRGNNIELITYAGTIPIDSVISVRVWGAVPDVGSVEFKVTSFNLRLLNKDANNTISEIIASINNNNNVSENFELNIGQVNAEPNADIKYLGGLFTSAGVAQVDWKRPEDTTPKNLLECVAEGYDLLNNRVSRQISGKLFWDWDFNYNLKDQGRILMINSGTWDPIEDTLSAEFIEVFEYKTTGAYDKGHDDGFDNNDTGDYKTNSTFTLTQKTE